MAFATTSLQGRSDEQRSWDLQLGLDGLKPKSHHGLIRIRANLSLITNIGNEVVGERRVRRKLEDHRTQRANRLKYARQPEPFGIAERALLSKRFLLGFPRRRRQKIGAALIVRWGRYSGVNRVPHVSPDRRELVADEALRLEDRGLVFTMLDVQVDDARQESADDYAHDPENGSSHESRLDAVADGGTWGLPEDRQGEGVTLDRGVPHSRGEMPRRPPTVCAEPGCPQPTIRRGRCQHHARAIEQPWEEARTERGGLRGWDRHREIRVICLQEIRDRVHEIAHATAEALGADIQGVPRADRHRQRLRALLDLAPTGDAALPQCGGVARGEPTADYGKAMAEAGAAIAVERRQMA
jgi:hypothetical protein